MYVRAATSPASMPAADTLIWHPAGLQAIKAFKREDFVGVCGFSSLDWVTSDFTDCYSGAMRPCEDKSASTLCLHLFAAHHNA